MRPDVRSRALLDVVTDLIGTAAGTTYFVKKSSGAGQRYDLPGSHHLVGRSAPDLELADGRRLADLMHDGRALLLDLADDAELRAVGEGYGDRVRVVTTTCPAGPAPTGLLVRPDGCTAWAADAADDRADATQHLAASLAQWFGTPVPVGG